MLIICPSCASEYNIDPATVGTKGRNVRCAACRELWFVAPENEILPPVEEAAPKKRFTLFKKRERQPKAPARSKPKGRRPGIGIAGFPARFLRIVPVTPLLLALCIALPIGAALARVPIVKALPQTAPLYAKLGMPVNLRGIAFKFVTSRIVQKDDQSFLVVEGQLANITPQDVELTPLLLSLMDETGQEIYRWTIEPPRQIVQATDSLSFRARLSSPPENGRQVLVRFDEGSKGH